MSLFDAFGCLAAGKEDDVLPMLTAAKREGERAALERFCNTVHKHVDQLVLTLDAKVSDSPVRGCALLNRFCVP